MVRKWQSLFPRVYLKCSYFWILLRYSVYFASDKLLCGCFRNPPLTQKLWYISRSKPILHSSFCLSKLLFLNYRPITARPNTAPIRFVAPSLTSFYLSLCFSAWQRRKRLQPGKPPPRCLPRSFWTNSWAKCPVTMPESDRILKVGMKDMTILKIGM